MKSLTAFLCMVMWTAGAVVASASAQEPEPQPMLGRYQILNDVYFYDTDIQRDAYRREPYQTTVMIDSATGRTWILMKVRDNRVVFFLRKLARGKHSVSYRMRAEIPGRFSALPTKAWAMYAPELKANSDEIKLRVED